MSKQLITIFAIALSFAFPVQAETVSVSGRVTLSPELNGKVSPDDTVFILARAANGPRMPLAVFRKQVKDLPMDFTLDDSMAMRPQMKLSNFPEVVVAARVSRTGHAVTQPGDYEGVSAPVKPGTTGIKIEINTEIR